MSGDSKVIDVRISDQILWIGQRAYSVRNITFVSPEEISADRSQILKKYLKTIFSFLFGCIAIFLFAGFVVEFVGQSISSTIILAPVVLVIAIAVIRAIWITIKLIADLSKRKLYALIVGTAGAQQALLFSYDENRLREIAGQITYAINNPGYNYQTAIRIDLRGAKGVKIGDGGIQNNTYGVPRGIG